MKVAIDAMGGDNAPAAVVEGSINAVKTLGIEIVLVGREESIRQELSKHSFPHDKISIHNASEVITMHESPVAAVKQKKDASVNVAIELHKQGLADAVVSAGNTGAYMTSAFLKLGRIPGIERPPIAGVFPTLTGHAIVLDVGANVDCKPKHLVQFAQVGYQYAKYVYEIPNPKVALLNIGEEEVKGNELTVNAYQMLKELTDINFIGNIEAKDILTGQADVVVCDGFIGNMILKFGEGVGMHIMRLIKNEVNSSFIAKLGAAFMALSLRRVRKLIDYDEYGGALLLGLNGICIKAHGRANARAIQNAIRRAVDSHNHGIVAKTKLTS